MEEENEENLRFKFVSSIDRQTRNLTIFQNVHVVELNQVEMMCYLTVPCFIPVSFPLRFYNFLSNAHLLVSSPRKSTRFWCPEVHFQAQSPLLSWSVISAKTLGTRIPLVSARGPLFRRAETTSRGGLGPPKFFGTRAEKFAFTRQKSSRPCPILLARVPKFRSAVLKMNVV